MPVRAKINWEKVEEFTLQVCVDNIKEHFNKIEQDDKRILKKIKEAFVGKNTWSHHKLRLGRQIAGLIWGVAKHAVPMGSAAEKARKAIQMAGQFYLKREIKAGRPVSDMARDIFDVTETTIHMKMEQFYDHIESIVLWQRELKACQDKGINSLKEQLYMLKCYTKLVLHYRDGHETSKELKALFQEQAAKLDAYTNVWAEENRATSHLFDMEKQLIAGVLFEPEIHTRYCEEQRCFAARDTATIMSFYTEYLEFDPVDVATFEKVGRTHLHESAFESAMTSYKWFSELRRKPTDAELGEKSRAISPDSTPITVSAWQSLLVLGSSELLSKTLFTQASFNSLLTEKDWFTRQRHRLQESDVNTKTAKLTPSQTVLNLKGWKDFSSVFGVMRSSETDAIDKAYKEYVEALPGQLTQFNLFTDGTRVSASQRTALMNQLELRIGKLSSLSNETGRYIMAKSANESSNRRHFIQMLDALVQRELKVLGDIWASVDARGASTMDIDRQLGEYLKAFGEQCKELEGLDSNKASTETYARSTVVHVLDSRLEELDKLDAVVDRYISSFIAAAEANRRPYVLMLAALLYQERLSVTALKAAFDFE